MSIQNQSILKPRLPSDTTSCSYQSNSTAESKFSYNEISKFDLNKHYEDQEKGYSNLQTIEEERKTSVHEEGDEDGSLNSKKEAAVFLGRTSYNVEETKLKAPNRQNLHGAFSLDLESNFQGQTNIPSSEKNKLFRHHSCPFFCIASLAENDPDDDESEFSFDLEQEGDIPEEEDLDGKGNRVRLLSGVGFSRGRSRAVDLTAENKKKKDAKKQKMKNIKLMRAAIAQANNKKTVKKHTELFSLKQSAPMELFSNEEDETLRSSTLLADDFNSVDHLSSSLLIEKRTSYEMPLTNLLDFKLVSSKSNPIWTCTHREYIIAALTNPENLRDSLRDPFNLAHKSTQMTLDKVKVKSFMAQLAQEALNHNIIDNIKLDERISDEPYILYKKGESRFTSTFTTNIQSIDIDKLLNMICEFKPYLNEKAQKLLEFSRSNLLKILLLSHDLFYSSLDLLMQLIKRFFIADPDKMSPKESIMFDQCIRTPAQYIILDIIASWIELRGRDFYENTNLYIFLESFIQYASSAESILRPNDRIKKALMLLSKYLKKNNTNFAIAAKSIVKSQNNLFDIQISQVLMLNLNVEMDIEGITEYFFRYNAKQMAANMTLIDLRSLKAMRIRHLPHNSKNLDDFIVEEEKFAFINQTNYLTFLMVYLIVAQQRLQKTEELILRLVDIAEELLKYNNFQSFSCIMGAITNMATQVYSKNIKETSSQILRKKKKSFEDLFTNTTLFRATINKTHLPKIPSIMIINEDLTKLVGVQDTYFELENHRKLINFKLMEETAAIIDGLDRAQKSTYTLREIKPELEGFLMDQPKKLMKKLDHRMNITQIQTELMKIAHRNVRINSHRV